MTDLTSTAPLAPAAGISVPGAAVYPGLDDWRGLPIAQQPTWSDSPSFAPTVKELSALPPLVFAGEVDVLRSRLAQAAQGNAFLLQGGDCAETFEAATADKISSRVKTILQMAVVLTYGAQLPVIKMGRMAGQFAKPSRLARAARMGRQDALQTALSAAVLLASGLAAWVAARLAAALRAVFRAAGRFAAASGLAEDAAG